MKTSSALPIQMVVRTLACGALLSLSPSVFASEPPPVSFPDLQHYSALWERSVFTTKDLPSPDAPSGPIFSDNLGLSGIYEVDGQVVAVLIDRTTSQFSEARIGSENAQGIKIRKVHPGATMDKTRVQLQKGDIAGWVTFGDAPPPSAPGPAEQPAMQSQPQQVMPAQPVQPPSATPLLPVPPVVVTPTTVRGGGMAPPPPAAMLNDVPLPPP